MKPTFLALTATLLLGACASVHPGRNGAPLDSTGRREVESLPVKISVEKIRGLSDDHYTFLAFTFENTGDRILRVKSNELDFEEATLQNTNVLVGQDLLAWAKGLQERQKREAHNAQWTQLALILGGMGTSAVGSATNNKALKLMGSGAALGGAAWTASSAINKSVTESHSPGRVPEEHIYAPFSVPARMFVRKWAVVETAPKAKIRKTYMDLNFDNQEERRYVFDVR